MKDRIVVPYWDNHLHARTDEVMRTVMPIKANRCSGGVYEPNTKPHLTTYDGVVAYQDEVDAATGRGNWVGSIYLTQKPNLKDVERLWLERRIAHIKVYPPGGSTNTDEAPPFEMLLDKNSAPGRLLCAAEDHGIPVKMHPEDAIEKDPYFREGIFYHELMPQLLDTYHRMRWIQAHISTDDGCYHMSQYGDPENHVGEFTAHHLFDHRGMVFEGGSLLPNHHCLPVIKSSRHWQALRNLLKERPSYMLAGSDAAAHLSKNKYGFCVFGGLFTYHCDLELYIQILEELGLLDYAPDFLYWNARRFHGDIVSNDPVLIELVKKKWKVNDLIMVPGTNPPDFMTPFGYHPEPEKRPVFDWQVAA